MTKGQWLIILVLAAGVAIVFCFGIVLLTNFSGYRSTQVAIEATATRELVSIFPPTNTPTPSAKPSATIVPTVIPVPATATLVIRPPSFNVQTQKIGPLLDTLRNETYSFQVTLTDVKWSDGNQFLKPKPGYTYVITYIIVKNLGPGSAYSISSFDFQVKDANGALRSSTLLVPAGFDCSLDMVDLTAGGSVEGCVGFEVPTTGRLEFIYAPFEYEGLKPGRYVSFVIRP